MKRIDELNTVATRQLGGLVADERLKARIRAASRERRATFAWKPALTLAAACALCLCVALWALPLGATAPDGPSATEYKLTSGAAGTLDRRPHVLRAGNDIPDGSITITGGASAPSAQSIFAPETNGSYPLVLVGGEAYRLLTAPATVPDALLGDSLGEVTEYTLEPALSTGGLVSNVVPSGETVYAIDGMRGAMIAASVRGELRAFQRVSFAGKAIVGSETLADTLASAARVTALQLGDADAIDDAALAQSLLQTLLDNAVYSSASASGSGTQTLLIYLDNGLTLQLLAGNDSVSACGTWSCPEFFDALAER